MVAVAQLVEHRVVVPGVAGSSPVSHPSNRGAGAIERLRFAIERLRFAIESVGTSAAGGSSAPSGTGSRRSRCLPSGTRAVVWCVVGRPHAPTKTCVAVASALFVVCAVVAGYGIYLLVKK
jgi:hypothetical protein